MDVVEGEDERLRSGEVLEEGAHGTMRAVALVLQPNILAAAERSQRREDVRQLRLGGVAQSREGVCVEAPDVVVQGVDEAGEGLIALQLGR
jgi:hypothetical protein